MNKWNSGGPVVAEVDGSAGGLRVVDYASAEALRWGVELVLTTPYAITASSTPIAPGPAGLSSASAIPVGLRSTVERAHRTVNGNVPLTLVTGEGPRLKVLPKAAQGARLLVIGGSAPGGARRLTAAQSELTLSSRVTCPTTVVPQGWQPSGQVGGVVVGVDGTELSNEALDFAFRTAAKRDVPLTVVHSATARRRAVDGEELQRRAERILSEVLAGWADQYAEVDVRRRPSREPAASVLLRESEDAELLVLGAQATALATFNPVARRIIAGSKCPVVILPHQVGATDQDIGWRELRPGSFIIPPTY